MKQFSIKFKLIFIPFLIIVISTTLIYTFLNWLLLIKLEIFNVDEMVIDVVGPIIVPGLSIFIWLRPRIKLLRLTERKNRDPLTGYIVIAWAVIGFTIGTSQQYLVTVTGKMTKLDYVSQINKVPKTKYYTLKHSYIDKKLARIKTLHKVTEKGRSYDMYLYAPCPIFDRDFVSDTITNSVPRDTINDIAKAPAWLAIRYEKTISNWLTPKEKEDAEDEFSKSCLRDFLAKNLNDFFYLKRTPQSAELEDYKYAIQVNDTSLQKPVTILSPVTDPYEFKNGDSLNKLFCAFVIGSFVFLIMLMLSPLKDPEANA